MFAPTISARDNPLIKRLHKLSKDGSAYRKLGHIWLEGEHLVSSYLQQHPASDPSYAQAQLIVADSHSAALSGQLAAWGHSQPPCQVQTVASALLPAISSLESPASIGLVLAYQAPTVQPISASPSVLLDRLQDAGNVGTILRLASAFGFAQVIAIKGTVALWSPKVLRAGMGAHFGLQLHELVDAESTLAELQALQLPLLATSSHQGDYLHRSPLPQPCVWMLGHEGQGLAPHWQAAASQHIRIWQHREESLNVATAAAICLHASASQTMLSA